MLSTIILAIIGGAIGSVVGIAIKTLIDRRKNK